MAKTRTRRGNRHKSRRRTKSRNMKGGGGGADYVAKMFGGIGQQHTGPNGSIAKMGGGSKRRGGRKKKGGFLGLGLAPIINQALVPFSLFGAQKLFRNK